MAAEAVSLIGKETLKNQISNVEVMYSVCSLLDIKLDFDPTVPGPALGSLIGGNRILRS
jgi:hypothetical protein